MVAAAADAGVREVMVAAAGAQEAALVTGMTVQAVRTLSEVQRFYEARSAGVDAVLPLPEALDSPWLVIHVVSAVIATVNNIGPGLGLVGPSSHFGVLTDLQIWVLSFAMVLGRLEMLAVLVLFTGQFWRK